MKDGSQRTLGQRRSTCPSWVLHEGWQPEYLRTTGLHAILDYLSYMKDGSQSTLGPRRSTCTILDYQSYMKDGSQSTLGRRDHPGLPVLHEGWPPEYLRTTQVYMTILDYLSYMKDGSQSTLGQRRSTSPSWTTCPT